MRFKYAHKGRAYMEPDRRIWLLIKHAASLNGIKQDYLLANALLLCLEDQRKALGEVYEQVYEATQQGEFARKYRKKKVEDVKETVEEGDPVPRLVAQYRLDGWTDQQIMQELSLEKLPDVKIEDMG